jgi:hypothetical protein
VLPDLEARPLPPPPKIELPDIQGSHFIKVLTLTGDNITQNVNLTDTIRIVKARLCQTEGGPLEGQRFRLVFEGRDLPNTELVGEAKLNKGAEVMAVLLRAEIGELECPEAGGRVHFSGCLMLDHFVYNWCSEPYVEDDFSEYVGVGNYPDNAKAFPKAISKTFDSVAVDAGTRVTICSEKNFQGTILWDRIGPALICNKNWKNQTFTDGGSSKNYSQELFRQWKEPLNTVFPPDVREFSESNMHQWDRGSLVVTAGQAMPEECEQIPIYRENSKKSRQEN